MVKFDIKNFLNPVCLPDWVEDYFNGTSIYWNQRLTEEDAKDAEKYIKKHGLKYERGRNGAWESAYNESQIAKHYNVQATTVSKYIQQGK